MTRQHPTPILLTTRSGSRSAVLGLNQSQHVRKVEPKRRRTRACTCSRIVEPGAKAPSPTAAVLDASPLLVILHYLLKNNTQFIGWNVQVKVSPPIPSTLPSHGGGI
jgi:hypothetical protein